MENNIGSNGNSGIESLKISRICHSCFRLEGSGKVIYIDPFRIENNGKADIIIITHQHFDHCSPPDIQKLIKPGTLIIIPPECQSKLAGMETEFRLVEPGDNMEIDGIRLSIVPAYNTNKFIRPMIPFHPKEDGKIGVVIEIDGKRIYHAGDTDAIPEMNELKDIDVAMVPVGGTYTMDADEAADAVNNMIRPKAVIPMHYGSGVVGTKADAERFRSLVKDAFVKML